MEKFKQRFREFDRGYFVVLLICLLALWPFITRLSLPRETDAELHVFRLAELLRLVSLENPYPRWAPNFYFGFGYPIFNYYAPLSYYLGLVGDWLLSVGAVGGVKSVFVLSAILPGIGMYGFMRDNWGRGAGIAASAAYLFAPYLLFIDPHARGDLAETLSLGLFPVALWSLDRLRRRPSSWNWLASVLFGGGLILSHNLMGFVFMGILLAWVLWHHLFALVPYAALNGRRIAAVLWNGRLFTALILSLGVTAFFWLPIILEREAVNLGSLVGQGGHFDFRNHFVPLIELLSPSKIIDWSATEPDFRFNLGISQWLLVLVSVILFVLKKSRNRKSTIFFILMLVLLLFLILSPSAFIWESIPYMDFMQFPWRLLGPTAAVMAVVIATGMGALENMVADKGRKWVPAAATLIILIPALPLLQVPPWPNSFGATTPLSVLEIELEGRWLGTTSTADFVPKTVEIDPRPQPALVDSFRRGEQIDRINRASLPDDVVIEYEEISPLHWRYNINAQRPFLLRVFVFDFPGWTAYIDGVEAETEIGRPDGFIVIPTLAGEHTIDLVFESTSERRISAAISFTSFILVVLAAWWFNKESFSAADSRLGADNTESSSKISLLPTIGIILLVFIMQAVGGNARGWFNIKSVGDTAVPAESDVAVNLRSGIRLIGYTLHDSMVNPEDVVQLDLYWKAAEIQEDNYQVFVHLVDSNGEILAQSDKLNPGDFPTERWPLDRYVRDIHQLELPENTPPGGYSIELGLWKAAAGERLQVVADNGEVLGDVYRLPQDVRVGR